MAYYLLTAVAALSYMTKLFSVVQMTYKHLKGKSELADSNLPNRVYAYYHNDEKVAVIVVKPSLNNQQLMTNWSVNELMSKQKRHFQTKLVVAALHTGASHKSSDDDYHHPPAINNLQRVTNSQLTETANSAAQHLSVSVELIV